MAKHGCGGWALPAAGAIAAGHNFYNAAKHARTGAIVQPEDIQELVEEVH